MEAVEGSDVIACADAAQWEAWLADHHQRPGGVWLKLAKKSSGIGSLTHKEALEIALCYGWIDSQRRAYDETYFLQRYSPRRPRSSWSRVNVDRVEALIAAGRMRTAGLAEVLAAKADGRWDAAYESQRNASIPADLAAALEQNERARSAFDRLDRTSRYAVILSLLKARTPGNRAVRLDKAIATLEAGDRAHE
jgi:uncharacterized protein YdeI (YjbR/CyaY-like superfamily)